MAACNNGGTNSEPNKPERVTEPLFEKRENASPDIDMVIWWPPKSDIQEINALYNKVYGAKVNVIEKHGEV